MCDIVKLANGEELHTVGELRRYLGDKSWNEVFTELDNQMLTDELCFCHVNVRGVLSDLQIKYQAVIEIYE